MLYEAYGHRGAFGEDLVHIVDWTYPQTAGPALCGLAIRPVRLEHVGLARCIGAQACAACTTELEGVPRANGRTRPERATRL